MKTKKSLFSLVVRAFPCLGSTSGPKLHYSRLRLGRNRRPAQRVSYADLADFGRMGASCDPGTPPPAAGRARGLPRAGPRPARPL